eukprot:TRINITY_DN12355_c0_g1_i1.p1 TRINITY_DN12355_c0_g1~~TRINITY_DN12355_c0_g1_i1.p1  ORF type:complete len:381 (-),score=70.13 TRINITY_DN12355_c0_g1_i1:121-1263(-)
MAETSADQVFEESNCHAGIIILNRPRQLNALSESMISKIHALYSRWESDDNTNVVIIKGTGRAFCSGGDVLSVCQLGNAGQYHKATKYFWDEYIMNYILATYCKPHVAFLNGIVMGGGAGISMHGRFRVATENTIFAMPETGLGLHPDVGASYFLSRLPGHFGEYVGLTGMRLNGVELFTCGLATHYVSSKHLRLLEERLSKVKAPDPEVVSSLIDACSENVCLNHDSALYRMDLIERCFSKETVEDILLGLELEATTVADQWLQSAIHSIKKASPISLKITLRSIREGRSQKLHECLIREYRMSYHCVYRKVSNDFYEGCRSILLDKDKNPKWNPSKLHDVSQEMVDHYFSPVGDDLTDLHLPTSERETRNHSPLKSKL